MLEGWELITIFGAVAVIMVVVLILALLYVFTRQKTNTPQGNALQQYSKQPQSQYNAAVNRVCLQCGLSMAGNANFCSNCGKHLN